MSAQRLPSVLAVEPAELLTFGRLPTCSTYGQCVSSTGALCAAAARRQDGHIDGICASRRPCLDQCLFHPTLCFHHKSKVVSEVARPPASGR